jgi:hypothetical protein
VEIKVLLHFFHGRIRIRKKIMDSDPGGQKQSDPDAEHCLLALQIFKIGAAELTVDFK